MSLYYANQTKQPLFGTKTDADVIDIRVTLATTYTQSHNVEVGGMSRIDIMCAYDPTTLGNKLTVKLEASNDGVNFFQLPVDATAGGTSTITAREFEYTSLTADEEFITFGIDISYKMLRVSVKGGAATDTLFAEALVSGR